MVGVTPSVRWFGSSWIGTKVIFFSITAVADEWTLEEKISESSSQADERTFMEVGTISEAWAVYTCSKVGEPGTNAVIKIRMQIPYLGSEPDPPQIRAEQATTKMIGFSSRELKVLKGFTKTNCTSAPTLLSYEQKKQAADMWIPGGYILYMLMPKLLGTPLGSMFWELDRGERDDIRQSFKEAYTKCLECGFVSYETSPDNIIWDKETKTCHIVDFKFSRKARAGENWTNFMWVVWNMARYVGEPIDDMSTWKL